MSIPATVPDGGLFSPFTLRGVTLSNRIGVSPMCMYSSQDGYVNDFHLVHLGRFALGGAGLVIMEATAISPIGRISHHDAGIWSDDHIPGLKRLTSFLSEHGSVPGIQLAHAGRRASVTEPWQGGLPLSPDAPDATERPWMTEAPSEIAAGPDWPVPSMLSVEEIAHLVTQWASAAKRAVNAGFRFIELHGAHGYLLHSFFSPLSNTRTDQYGGDIDSRMRFPLEVVEALRQAIPDDIALSYRVSSVDGVPDGITLDDTIVFSKRLAEAGVDLVDTSSGGITTDRSVDTRVRRGFAFHADFSQAVRLHAGVPTATVGMVIDPEQAALLIDTGSCDVVLLGRGMLDDPNWPMHARHHHNSPDPVADVRFDTYLPPWRRSIEKLLEGGESPLSRFSGESVQ